MGLDYLDLDYLKHYGTPRHSGRYPWGSGKNPQRNKNFRGLVDDYRKQGLSEKEISEALGLTTRQYKARLSNVNNEIRIEEHYKAVSLYNEYVNRHDGNTYGAVSAVARKMGKNESSVRSLLDEDKFERSIQAQETANTLKKQISNKTYLDIGTGSNYTLGISATKLDTAVAKLQDEGYEVHNVYVNQLGTGKRTTVKVLAPPDTQWAEVQNHPERIKLINGYTPDNGLTLRGIEPPVPISSKRVSVKYAEDGGIDKDGVIELRRGVSDISLGSANYAQVRISVDGTHYLKGMAVYGEDKDFPPGKDIVFNTNKHKGTPMMGPKDNTVLKNIKDDPENPFGATIKSGDKLTICQRYYKGKDGKQHQSVLNIVNEQGDWSKWSKTLSSQFLSKQPIQLAERQLDLARQRKRRELDEIKSLTNPVVKKKLLESYADDTDSAAVHLKAAAFSRSAMHVLLPLPGTKENQVYAPNYKNGEHVALVRYPHAGKFEIPELVVNNNLRVAKKIIGQAPDAIGIHPKVASKLSGADFDGDTVMVIPITNRSKVQSEPTLTYRNKSGRLRKLSDFEPKDIYKIHPGDGIPETNAKNGFNRQRQMGSISNLITDMTLKGASDDEKVRAVKHSMVVIDAEKHNLNWRQSEIDNGIKALKKKYQGRENAGASTLISRASSDKYIRYRKELTNPKKMNAKQLADWKAGKKVYVDSPRYKYKDGKPISEVKLKTTKMADALERYDNAYKVMKDKNKATPMEKIYADHANALNSYAKEARRTSRSLKMPAMSSSAKKVYANEVISLNEKAKTFVARKPYERQAQIIAGTNYKRAVQANPGLSKDDKKKLRNQYLEGARARVGKKPYTIDIAPKEWEAIQAHAVSSSTVRTILDGADMDQVRKYATPRSQHTVSSSQKSAIRRMLATGKYTQAEIAEELGISTSTVSSVSSGN